MRSLRALLLLAFLLTLPLLATPAGLRWLNQHLRPTPLLRSAQPEVAAPHDDDVPEPRRLAASSWQP